jgi:hypothetical protein
MSAITPRQAAENATFPFGDYIVDPSRRLVCAAIPKNGCSDLKHWFISLVEPQKLADPSFRLHMYCRATHTLSQHSSARRAELLRDSFTLAFVRDPLSRVVSAYVEKFVRPAPNELFEPGREVLEQVAPGRSEGITFREFVRFLEEAPDEHLDQHWRAQSSFIDGVRVDLLGRMEHLRGILDILGAELGMPARSATRRNATGYTEARGEMLADVASAELHRRGVLPPASDLLDDALRERVAARFRNDVMLYEAATDHVSTAAMERFSALVACTKGVSARGEQQV